MILPSIWRPCGSGWSRGDRSRSSTCGPPRSARSGRFQGSIHVDAYHALKAGDPQALAAVAVPGNAPVVTICGAGKISLIAAQQLQARGVPARSLLGGMQAWSLAWNHAAVPLPAERRTRRPGSAHGEGLPLVPDRRG